MISKNNVRSFNALFSRMICDESGAELVEAALVIGLIAVLCIASMKGVSTSIAQRWNDLLDAVSPADHNA